VKAFVGVTDGSWYRFLRDRPHLTEVNFWRPSGAGFRAIATGEPFLFKTHYPDNRLVGVGFLSGFARLKLSEAWDCFGEGNGSGSLAEMRRAIASYRKVPLASSEDPEIGCVLLRDVEFSPPSTTLPAPPDFAPNIVAGKTYDLMATSGSYVEDALAHLLRASHVARSVPGSVFGDPRLVANRVGQRAFKALLLDAYQRRCAITGAKITPVLDAAHIRPVAMEGSNRLDNGLLLRSDVHKMFDRGYLAVHPRSLSLQVSPRLREEFGNGQEFYSRQGQSLVAVPTRRVDRPSSEALEWHMDTVFLSA
jgi:putative restriction endonuclease